MVPRTRGDRSRLSLKEAELLAPDPKLDVLAPDEALTGFAATDHAAMEAVPPNANR